ncbi:MAG: hypothetical protein AAB578_08470, partial [Elusimicrobiota bacterium]
MSETAATKASEAALPRVIPRSAAPGVLRGALLGFGQVAEDAHAPAFERNPGFSIVAVADPAPKRLAA